MPQGRKGGTDLKISRGKIITVKKNVKAANKNDSVSQGDGAAAIAVAPRDRI